MNVQLADMFMIRITASLREPLLKIFRKIGFAHFAGSEKRFSEKLNNAIRSAAPAGGYGAFCFFLPENFRIEAFIFHGTEGVKDALFVFFVGYPVPFVRGAKNFDFRPSLL